MLKRLKQVIMGGMGLAALALGASAIAGAATGTSTPTAATTTTPPGGEGGPPPGFSSADAPGTAAHENAEKAVSGEAAEKAKAAALASVGGGTAGAVTGDIRNSGNYEVAVTKPDGSHVIVRLDKTFRVESHPGRPGAGPGDAGGPGPADSRTQGPSAA